MTRCLSEKASRGDHADVAAVSWPTKGTTVKRSGVTAIVSVSNRSLLDVGCIASHVLDFLDFSIDPSTESAMRLNACSVGSRKNAGSAPVSTSWLAASDPW